ncbi:MAG TPA: hypothetical protein EYP39_05590 [Ghiorsea sp.]|nr:hypothetical protein [Ghiorsea sp.]
MQEKGLLGKLPWRKKDGFYLKRWQLQTGDIIQIKQLKIHVITTKNQLKLSIPSIKATAVWQDRSLKATEKNYDGCPAESPKASIKRFTGIQETLFTLGGKVQCIDRWKLKGIPLATARIEYTEGSYWLYPQRNDVLFSFQRGKTVKAINALGVDASSLDTIIIGRTKYKLSSTDSQLTLKSLNRIPLLTEKPEKQLGQHWKKATWSGAVATIKGDEIGKGFYLVSAFLLLLVLWMAGLNRTWWYHLQRDYAVWKSVVALMLPMLAFSMGWRIVGEQLGYLLLLVATSWGWLSLLLWRHQWLKGLSGWLWFLMLFLAGFGVITLTQLAAGAGNTYWISFPQRYLTFLLV